MTTETRHGRSPRLSTSRADELVYAIALAMARHQMRRNWGIRLPARMKGRPAAPMGLALRDARRISERP